MVYVHEESASNETKGEANLWLKRGNTKVK